jgi:hypothetical protein
MDCDGFLGIKNIGISRGMASEMGEGNCGKSFGMGEKKSTFSERFEFRVMK